MSDLLFALVAVCLAPPVLAVLILVVDEVLVAWEQWREVRRGECHKEGPR